MVQWLALGAFTAVALGVQSLVGELRSHKPKKTPENKNNTKKNTPVNDFLKFLIKLTSAMQC